MTLKFNRAVTMLAEPMEQQQEDKGPPRIVDCHWQGPPPSPYQSVSDWFEQEGSRGILRGLRISSFQSHGGESLTEQDVMDLAEEVEFKLLPQDVVTRALFLFEFAKSVLLNYGNFQPSPVPVAEGLPGPKDCDTEGACWWFNPGVKVSSNPFIAFSSWRLTPMLSSKPMGTHWLPHYTQPSPQQLPDSPYLFGTSLKEHKPFPPS